MNAANALRTGGRARQQIGGASRGYATPVDVPTEYAFEVAASNLRFGEGVTRVSAGPVCSAAGSALSEVGRRLVGASCRPSRLLAVFL